MKRTLPEFGVLLPGIAGLIVLTVYLALLLQVESQTEIAALLVIRNNFV